MGALRRGDAPCGPPRVEAGAAAHLLEFAADADPQAHDRYLGASARVDGRVHVLDQPGSGAQG